FHQGIISGPVLLCGDERGSDSCPQWTGPHAIQRLEPGSLV
ncbi:uncharacterized protein METZ01_LOCUS277646, partial [marine metagenome]